jgi:hypothetical protein
MHGLLSLLSPLCSDITSAHILSINNQQITLKFILNNQKDFTHVLDYAFDLEMTKDLIVEKYKDII